VTNPIKVYVDSALGTSIWTSNITPVQYLVCSSTAVWNTMYVFYKAAKWDYTRAIIQVGSGLEVPNKCVEW